MIRIGNYSLRSNVVLAPMAGVTDRPFRQLCRQWGAGLVTSEMVIANHKLWHSNKTQQRIDHAGENSPISVQIAGADPLQMAETAKFNVDRGAQIIDINMGCPAKKVCRKAAGSALLQDEGLVKAIVAAVVQAVNVPVTLKIRTGWNRENRNAVNIARIAEGEGIQCLAVHGRTRQCGFHGSVEYDTISAVKQNVSIPVLANGDIDSAQKAKIIIDTTGVDGVMIGRAAQGRPWLFREINSFLTTGRVAAPPTIEEQRDTLSGHLQSLHDFYGEFLGVRIARKHVGWYLKAQHVSDSIRKQFNHLESAADQGLYLQQIFDTILNPIEEQTA